MTFWLGIQNDGILMYLVLYNILAYFIWIWNFWLSYLNITFWTDLPENENLIFCKFFMHLIWIFYISYLNIPCCITLYDICCIILIWHFDISYFNIYILYLNTTFWHMLYVGTIICLKHKIGTWEYYVICFWEKHISSLFWCRL